MAQQASPNSGFPEHLTHSEIRARATTFVAEWSEKPAREIADSQTFWTDLFRVYGLERRRVATFEKATNGGRRADLLWPGVVIVEMKSPGKSLDAAMSQAFSYARELSADTIPRWVVVSDFRRFLIRDLELDTSSELSLEELPSRVSALAFLRGAPSEVTVEEAVTRRAADSLAGLYQDLVERGYLEDAAQLIICRFAWLAFAEDAGILDPHCFRDIILSTRPDGSDLGPTLITLFQWIGTPNASRMLGAPTSLEPFIHVPGWLFTDSIPVPMLDQGFRSAVIQGTRLDWERVDPAIFGSLFEGILSAKDRRQTGSHYTSETDVLRVIRPTILSRLENELLACGGSMVAARRFRERLSQVTVLDPACGTGNFLTTALRELVRLDVHAATIAGDSRPSVSLKAVAGIEIQGFAARLARLCLEITWHQSQVDARGKLGRWPWPEPFAESQRVVRADALTTDWLDVVPGDELTAIVGNPPYLGSRGWSPGQRAALKALYKPLKGVKSTGSLDLCAAWLVKGAAIQGRFPGVRAGWVTTNSLTQGQQPAPLWDSMRAVCPGIRLNWARTSFVWSGSAAVHCVLLGLENGGDGPVKLWRGDGDEPESHQMIGPYLVPGTDVIVRKRSKPWRTDTPEMVYGSKPCDGGNLILNESERDSLLEDHPEITDLIRPFVGARELLYHDRRWCLWLTDCEPSRWSGIPEIRRRVAAVREMRLKSSSKSTREAGLDRPHEFVRISYQGGVIVPRHFSENRLWITPNHLPHSVSGDHNQVIVGNDISMVSSRMHMTWVKQFAGRLKADLRYSASLCYNTFPFPDPTPSQRATIESAAEAVLEARQAHPSLCLAELYDPLAMPENLRTAHAELDHAVERAYRVEPFADDAERLEFLLDRYQDLIAA